MQLPRWGDLKTLAALSGLSVRMLAYIRKQEPNVLLYRENGKGVEFDIPACNTNLRKRERQMALKDAEPKDFEEARTRKMAAEARLAELEQARMEGRTVDVEEAARTVDGVLAQLRAQLVTFPQRWSPRLVGVPTITKVQGVLEEAIDETMRTLSRSKG